MPPTRLHMWPQRPKLQTKLDILLKNARISKSKLQTKIRLAIAEVLPNVILVFRGRASTRILFASTAKKDTTMYTKDMSKMMVKSGYCD